MWYKFWMIMMCASMAFSAPTQVVFETNVGNFVVELNADKAPLSVKNFLDYVQNGHYNGTIFHRVINGFMIQGGGFTPSLEQKATLAPIALESKNGLKNVRYSLAMARTAIPDSATSQFYINVVDNPMLDYPNPDGYGYTVFGQVVEGTEVIDSIKAVATHSQQGMQNVPVTPIVITQASLRSSEE